MPIDCSVDFIESKLSEDTDRIAQMPKMDNAQSGLIFVVRTDGKWSFLQWDKADQSHECQALFSLKTGKNRLPSAKFCLAL